MDSKELAARVSSTAVTPQIADAMRHSSTHLVLAQELTSTEVAQMRNTVTMASVPADEEWIRGRIATLLAHYWIDRLDAGLAKAVADDWVAAIMMEPVPPSWAIQNACVAWLASEHSRKKPTPGDIKALINVEMMWVYEIRTRLFYEDHPRAKDWHPLRDKLRPRDASQ